MSKKYNDNAYMAICSEKTLQSNEKGFFLNFAEHVAKNAGENWIKNVFGKLTSDRDRIRAIYEYSGTKTSICDVLSNVQEVYRAKSAEVSQARRLDAENSFKSGDINQSLMLFSQSVLRAPNTGLNPGIDAGLSLPLALWGRAQVLFAKEEYKLALTDIQLCLKEGLPNIYKPDAYWKMGICYKALNEENRASVAFGLTEKLLPKKEKIEALKEDTKKSFVMKENKSRRVEPVIETPHSEFPHASKKITVRQTKGLGRYVVANEKLSTGDTIAVEPAYAACLLPNVFGTHCHHCFDRLVSPIGCSNCSSVAFCKIECRDTAISTYHKYECKFLDLLIGSGMSILAHTALRMVTQISKSKCLEMYKNRSKEKIFSLCTNAGMRPAEDFLQRTLMAAFLLRCLQKSGYFKMNNKEVIPTEEEYCVGEMLLFFLQMLQFSAHEIYETRCSLDHRFRQSKVAYIAVGVYPTVALFNHDCDPGVIRYFVGKNIVIKAARPLNPEQVIAENYGPIFTRKPFADRQRSLYSRYWFNCQCEACTLRWPTLDTGLENVSLQVKCANRKCSYYFSLSVGPEVTCPNCKNVVSLSTQIEKIEWCEAQYKLAFEAMESDKPEKGINILCKALDIFHRISRPPHKSTHLAQETLRALMADSGNVNETLVKPKT